MGICKFSYFIFQNCYTSSSSNNSLTSVGLPQLYASLLRTVMLKDVCGCSHLLQQFRKFWWKPAPRRRPYKCWNTEIQKTHHRLYKYMNFWKSNLLGSNIHFCTQEKKKKIDDLILFFVWFCLCFRSKIKWKAWHIKCHVIKTIMFYNNPENDISNNL